MQRDHCNFFIADLLASSGDGLFSYECAFSTEGPARRSLQRVAINTLLPWMLLAFFILCSTLASMHKRKKSWAELFYFWNISAISIFYITYIDVTRNLLKILDCTKLDEAWEEPEQNAIALSRYWVEDPEVECYKGGHLALLLGLLVPGLPMITIGMPLWILRTVFWMQKHSSDRSFHEAYAFLHRSYRENFKYWEVVIMLRKALLAAVTVFSVYLGGNLQAILALAILVIAAFAQLLTRPFVTDGPPLNTMETLSLACSILAFLVGLLFNDPRTPKLGRSIASWIFIFSLAIVSLYILRELTRELMKLADRFLYNSSVDADKTMNVLEKIWFLTRLKKRTWSQGKPS